MRRRDTLRVGAITIGGILTGTSVGSTRAAASGEVEPLGSLEVPLAKELVVADDVAYVAVTDGFATVDTSDPTEPTLLAERRDLLSEHPDGPLEDIFDGKVGGDYYALGGPANPVDGVPYAAMVFDISDPADPEEVLTHETDFYHHNLDTDGETLYLCGNDGETNPLVCVDIETGEELGRWSVVDTDERWADVHHTLREIHDVWVEDDIAYVSNWNAGTWLVDVSDPTDPVPIANFRGLDPDQQATLNSQEERRPWRLQLPGNDHFAMPQRGRDSSLVAINQEAWGAEEDAPSSELGGVEIWDADTGEQLARIEAPPTDDATFGGVWTTAHNFDFVGDRLYTSWYRGGVKVHDVSDPTDPEELAHWRDTETTDFWTAQQGSGDYFVASSFRDHSMRASSEGATIYTFPDPDGFTSDETFGSGGAGVGLLAGAAGLGAAALARWLTDDDS